MNQELEHLRSFAAAYQYDTSYLEELLNSTKDGFEAFSAAQPLSSYRSKLPKDAHFIARIATTQGEDCGACAQLNLRMAVEAGVDKALLETYINAPETLSPILQDVHAHASAVARGEASDDGRTARLREHYGDEAFAELALAITGSRIFPSLKRALGTTTACAVLNLDFAREALAG